MKMEIDPNQKSDITVKWFIYITCKFTWFLKLCLFLIVQIISTNPGSTESYGFQNPKFIHQFHQSNFKKKSSSNLTSTRNRPRRASNSRIRSHPCSRNWTWAPPAKRRSLQNPHAQRNHTDQSDPKTRTRKKKMGATPRILGLLLSPGR